MKQFWLLIAFTFCVLFVYPQSESNNGREEIEKQYDNFKKKTFDKEFADDKNDADEHDTKIKSYLPPAELPAWMLSFDDLFSNGQLVVFGISDPGLDSTLAMEQAKVRALGLLSIFGGASVQNITDFYSSETRDNDIVGKFSSFSKIESLISFNLSHLKIFKQGFTDYGEAIILAGFEENGINTADIKGIVMADYFLSEEGDYDKLSVYSTYNFEMNLRGNPTSEFSCHNTKKNILITSSHNNEILEFDYGRFKYFFPQELTISDEELLNYSYTNLSDGLWNAYFSGILRQVEMTDKSTSEIKRMGDQYSGKLQTLTREISNLELSFKLVGIFVKDNTLYLKIESSI